MVMDRQLAQTIVSAVTKLKKVGPTSYEADGYVVMKRSGYAGQPKGEVLWEIKIKKTMRTVATVGSLKQARDWISKRVSHYGPA